MSDYWTDGPVGFVGFRCELKPPPSERQYLYFCAQREWTSRMGPMRFQEQVSFRVDVVTPLPSALRDMFQQRNLSLLPLPKELEGFHDVIWQGRGCLAKTLSGPSRPVMVPTRMIPEQYLLPAICDYWMNGRPFEEWLGK